MNDPCLYIEVAAKYNVPSSHGACDRTVDLNELLRCLGRITALGLHLSLLMINKIEWTQLIKNML